MLFHAQPYDISATGFYFTDFDDYAAKERKHRCEEFEIQFIDGDTELAEILEAMGSGLNQATLAENLELLDEYLCLAEYEQASVLFLMADRHKTFQEALELCENIHPVHSSGLCEVWDEEGLVREYVQMELLDCLLEEIPEHLRFYFDDAAYARDIGHEYTGIQTSKGWFLFSDHD